MYREAEKYLVAWINNPNRSPLMLRGARQVGKTYLVEKVARQYFANTVTINFEFMPQCAECFNNLDPSEIINKLQLNTGKTIDPKDTLLFLDEIQDCPKAIVALRYFKEKMPELSVIAAGSLLEFTLEDKEFRMPVGRVEFLHLHPLSFKEFLIALDEKPLVKWIESVNIDDEVSDSLHQKCLDLVRTYCFIGGMPEAVKQYIINRTDLTQVQNQHAKLLQGYQLDFGKYAKTKGEHRYLQKTFSRLSDIVGQQVKYSKIDPNTATKEIKHSLTQLKLAGLCNLIYASSGAGIPLAANANLKKFKLIYLDIGLYLRDLNLNPNIINHEELSLINAGSLTEQFVGQQLICAQLPLEMPHLYFWARDKKGSSAEVDYLWQLNEKIIPIEVKAGASGRLKSLHSFKELYQSGFGVRISKEKMQWEKNEVLSIPFYLTTEISRLILNVK